MRCRQAKARKLRMDIRRYPSVQGAEKAATGNQWNTRVVPSPRLLAWSFPKGAGALWHLRETEEHRAPWHLLTR